MILSIHKFKSWFNSNIQKTLTCHFFYHCKTILSTWAQFHNGNFVLLTFTNSNSFDPINGNLGKGKESDPTDASTDVLATVYSSNVQDASVVCRWCVGGAPVTLFGSSLCKSMLNLPFLLWRLLRKTFTHDMQMNNFVLAAILFVLYFSVRIP